MKYLMVHPQFARMVSLGNKLMTIRPTPKRPHQPGDLVQLRCWQGRPYASRQLPLADVRITHATAIELTEIETQTKVRREVAISGPPETWPMLPRTLLNFDTFARFDGFNNADEFRAWFHLPGTFKGILYLWEYLGGYPCPIPPCATCRHGSRIGVKRCALAKDCWEGDPNRMNRASHIGQRIDYYTEPEGPGICLPDRRHISDGGQHDPQNFPRPGYYRTPTQIREWNP